MNKDIVEIENQGLTVYRCYFDSIVCDKNDYMDSKVDVICNKYKLENKEWNNKIGIFLNSKTWKKLE